MSSAYAICRAREPASVDLPSIPAGWEYDIRGAMAEAGLVVALRWRIELRDASGGVLARKTFFCEYSAPF
jgi:hypothetical protein